MTRVTRESLTKQAPHIILSLDTLTMLRTHSNDRTIHAIMNNAITGRVAVSLESDTPLAIVRRSAAMDKAIERESLSEQREGSAASQV